LRKRFSAQRLRQIQVRDTRSGNAGQGFNL